jgi:hypothetical protein
MTTHVEQLGRVGAGRPEEISMGASSTGPDEGDRLPERQELFVARVTEQADGVERCVIAPLPESDRMLLAEWIAADEGSFVALAELA